MKIEIIKRYSGNYYGLIHLNKKIYSTPDFPSRTEAEEYTNEVYQELNEYIIWEVVRKIANTLIITIGILAIYSIITLL